MSDISRMLCNEITETLRKLSLSGVGFINCETADAIEYQIDCRIFEIKITEKDR